MLYEKIVVIDDNPRQLESVKLALGRYFEVVCFNNGKEALEYLRCPHGVRLVLTDVCMQGMDGLSVLQEIRDLGRDIAVIIMTGFGSREVVVQALRGGADEFIDKPFDVVDLRGGRCNGFWKESLVRWMKNRLYPND
ncbi:MAG: response regulator [Candidatus Omnitrophota bacterium]